MERIVYVLGAGFSAPLGIPVIRDFLITAKDLYFSDQEKFAHFGDVLVRINEMHKCKSYYNVDLFNIEEILSILEMEDQIEGGDRSSQFAEFIVSVIEACTPEMSPPSISGDSNGYSPYASSYGLEFFGRKSEITTCYGLFVANLLGLRLQAHRYSTNNDTRVEYRPSRIPDHPFEYSVVTLNYDLIIENCLAHIVKYHSRIREAPEIGLPPLEIAKLHGSVGSEVVAPTWRKWVRGELQGQWVLAHRLLSEANHIRILGYSLPTSDSYIRYLLSSAVLNSDHLKSIDVICLDGPDGSVRRRYEEFITFEFFRFQSLNISRYMGETIGSDGGPSLVQSRRARDREDGPSWADYSGLETRHNYMMNIAAD